MENTKEKFILLMLHKTKYFGGDKFYVSFGTFDTIELAQKKAREKGFHSFRVVKESMVTKILSTQLNVKDRYTINETV